MSTRILQIPGALCSTQPSPWYAALPRGDHPFMPTRGNYMETKKKPGPPTGQLVDGSQPVKLDGLADAVKSATKDRMSNR